MRESAVNRANKKQMLQCLPVTRKSRRDLMKDKNLTTDIIINKYPILMTLNEAVGFFIHAAFIYFCKLNRQFFKVLEEFEAVTGKRLDIIVKTWDAIEDFIVEEAERKFEKNTKSAGAMELISAAKIAKEQFR